MLSMQRVNNPGSNPKPSELRYQYNCPEMYQRCQKGTFHLRIDVYWSFCACSNLWQVRQPGRDLGQRKVVFVVIAAPSQWSDLLPAYVSCLVTYARSYSEGAAVHLNLGYSNVSIIICSLERVFIYDNLENSCNKYPARFWNHFGERIAANWWTCL